MSALTFSATDQPAPEDIEALKAQLFDFFRPLSVGTDQKVAIFVRDENGATVAGLSAKIGWEQLYIDILYVADAFRGQGLGKKLMEMAEGEGRRHGVHSAWLMTSTQEAKRFYEARGFVCFGAVERHAPSDARYFMKKRL